MRIQPCSCQTLIPSITFLFVAKKTFARGKCQAELQNTAADVGRLRDEVHALHHSKKVNMFSMQKPAREGGEITPIDVIYCIHVSAERTEKIKGLSPLIATISFVISVLLLLISAAILTAIESKKTQKPGPPIHPSIRPFSSAEDQNPVRTEI